MSRQRPVLVDLHAVRKPRRAGRRGPDHHLDDDIHRRRMLKSQSHGNLLPRMQRMHESLQDQMRTSWLQHQRHMPIDGKRLRVTGF